ncbi:Fimbrial assembly family protein [Delftia acidovorans SPH-1]|uniref:Fimbrial assembly family protein n=1 Tax=Delftia acidovorans (strain DSM 14801 / SPH-1) TaxID=398578 RepID=A9BXD3_DELAS|nr:MULTISPECIES: PilN domain-containing protein [Delftia]MCP4017782.1 fimbrial protein [Delftia sp.]OLE94029.1 MAG: fimbrial protein [Delftia sp. 13_1_40CM_3_66_6]ABX38209.1 Fimbrial assembly family protein [Delftia acidovorans SPH-1]MBN9322500.1 PilN domain-containing protein [Delftia acidovorans]MCP4532205.1 fimbrial protein [Delftia sp.]
MILINLLPHREATRKRRKEAFQATMVLSALVGLLIIGAVYWWYQMMIEAQQAKNSMLRAEITVLESQIKEIAGLEDEITALRARQKAVEDLQSDRNLPVHMLNELVAQLPDGVYLSSIKQEGLVVTMQGTAQSNERVSEMLRNLSEGTPWISKPELAEIVAKTVNVTPKDQRRAAAFNLRFQLTRASVAEKSLSTAANPGKSQ